MVVKFHLFRIKITSVETDVLFLQFDYNTEIFFNELNSDNYNRHYLHI